MKFSSIVTTTLSSVALAAAMAAGTAYADDMITDVTLDGNGNGTLSAHFGVTHTETGDFVDVFNFSPSDGSWLVDASLITIGFQPASNVDFYQAEINGYAMSLTPNGTFEYGLLFNEPITGPLVLTVYGSVEGVAGTGASASYAGTINISPIPEPATYGMLLGGLGVLGWLSRRKVQKST